MARVESRLRPTSIVVMDDIEDNTFFRDYAATNPKAKVIGHSSHFIGTIGLPQLLAS